MSRIITFFTFTGVFFLTACNSLSFHRPSPAERQAEVNAIYRIILNRGETGDKYNRCIINHSITKSEAIGSIQLNPNSYPFLDPKLIDDYNSQIKVSNLFSPDLTSNLDAIWLENYDLSFFGEYKCMYIEGFSNVGFNQRMDEALVYKEDLAPPYALAGGGDIYFVKKGEDGNWEVVESIRVWIS